MHGDQETLNGEQQQVEQPAAGEQQTTAGAETSPTDDVAHDAGASDDQAGGEGEDGEDTPSD